MLVQLSVDPAAQARLLPGGRPRSWPVLGAPAHLFAGAGLLHLHVEPAPLAAPLAMDRRHRPATAHRLGAALAAAWGPDPDPGVSGPLAAALVPVGPDAAALFGPLGYQLGREPHQLRLRGEGRPGPFIEQLGLLLSLLDPDGVPEEDRPAWEARLRAAGPWVSAYRGALGELLRPRAARRRDPALCRLIGEGRHSPGPEAPPADHRQAELAVAAVLAALRRLRAQRVAELNCGDGRLLKALLADAALIELIGLDPCRQTLELARRRLPEDPRLHLHQGLAFAADSRLGLADAIVLRDGLAALGPGRRPLLAAHLFTLLRPATVIFTLPAGPAPALDWIPDYTVTIEPIGEGARAGHLVVCRR